MAHDTRNPKMSLLRKSVLLLHDSLFPDRAKVRFDVGGNNSGGSGTMYGMNDTRDYEVSTVDSKFARRLYRNKVNSLALSGHFVKTTIDSSLIFMGNPFLQTDDEVARSAFNKVTASLEYKEIMRIAEREGTAYVWVQYDGATDEYMFQVLPNETISKVYINPDTKKPIGYKISEQFSYTDVLDRKVFVRKEIKVTSQYIEMYENDVHRGTYPTPFGILPIFVVTNDKEPWDISGYSEIERLVPQLKLYHDVTFDAADAQRQNGKSKVVVQAFDPKDFIDNHWGSGTYASMLAGTAKISMEDRDLYVVKANNNGLSTSSEDVHIIEANKTTGDYSILSEKAFTNIIEGAGTPEIVFGASMGASLSSVQEQRPAYIKRLESKQVQYGKQFTAMIHYALDLYGMVNFTRFKPDTWQLVWDRPDFATDKEKAETINFISTAVAKGRAGGFLSDEAIHKTLLDFAFLKINPDFKKYLSELKRTAKRRSEEPTNRNNNLNMIERTADGESDNTKTAVNTAQEDEEK